MGDPDEPAAGLEGREPAEDGLSALGLDQLEVGDDDEVVVVGPVRRRGVRDDPGDAVGDAGVPVSCWARRRPLSRPTAEKSVAVTVQPRCASQIALRPSPAARSSARPGDRSAHTSATNRLGSADQTSSDAAYRSSQPAASMPASLARLSAVGGWP